MLLRAAAVRADVAEAVRPAEGAVDDVDGQVVELIEDTDRRAAHVGTGVVAALSKKRELTTLRRPPRTKIAPPPSGSFAASRRRRRT